MRARHLGATATVVVMLVCVVPAVAIPVAHGKILGLFGPDLGAAVSFTLVGAFLLLRGSVRSIAVIMCVQGVGAAVTTLSGVLRALAAQSGPLHGVGLWAAWTNQLSWLPGVLLLTPLVLLFPDGRLASRGWRWPIVVVVTVGTVATLGAVILREPMVDGKPYSFAPNPTGLFTVPLPITDAAGSIAYLSLIVCIAVSIGSLVTRRRRAHGVRRAQLTSLLYGVTVTVVLLVVQIPLQDEAGQLFFALELCTVAPVAASIAVAVLRYRLFEVDRLVSRTVTYAIVLAVLAGIYIGVVTGLAALVPHRYGNLGVAIATLAVAALAVPLTRRVRRIIDRRFNRARFDAELVATEFAVQLRSRADRGDVPDELLEVVQRTVAPTHATVWLISQL